MKTAQAIGFVACLKDSPETKMGLFHAAYGTFKIWRSLTNANLIGSYLGGGALSAPLVATQFARAQHWSLHYLISLGLAISNAVLLVIVFRFKTHDGTSPFFGLPLTTIDCS